MDRVAQVVEQETFNLQVAGSSPAPVTQKWLTSGRGRRGNLRRGEASEVEVFAALRRAGYTVLVAPFAGSLCYDCAIDDGKTIARVQIKTGYVDKHGAVRWATRSTGGTQATIDYRGRVQYFAVWVPELGTAYLVPVNDVGRREASLRLRPTANNQEAGIRWAHDYELSANAATV